MRIKVVWASIVLAIVSTALGQTQLIVNGGFESGTAPWQTTGFGTGVLTDAPNANSGNNYLALGGAANANLTAFQTISIPSNALSAELSYFWQYNSVDANGTVVMQAQIEDTNGTVLAVVDSEANQFSVTSSYVQNVYDLSAFIGQTFRVVFEVGTAAGLGSGTTFRIDDVQAAYVSPGDLPQNDYFTNRIVLTGSATNFFATNTFATKEPGEPKHADRPGGHSLWWTWTAPANGALTLSTVGSSFDTLLAVYTGSSISNLTQVAANNDIDIFTITSKVKASVTAGTQYQIVVDGNSGAVGSIDFTLKFVPDSTPPKVKITSPAAGGKVTNSTVTVTGTASDNIAIDRIEFRLENAAGTNDYQIADGTNAWSAVVTNLVPGTNTVRVRAFDTSDNVAVAAQTFQYVIVSPFTLTVSGNGTVTPNLSGQLLAIGTSFTVTAKASSGSVFAGWTGDLSADTAAFTFIMQSNLTLQANFIPNPFGPAVGVYQGLFFDTNGVTHQSSGFINASVTGAGSFSAKVMVAGLSYSLSGSFTASGFASNSIARKGLTPVSVRLQLDLGGGGITGLLTDGSWMAELTAYRASAAAAAGNYTLVLPGSDDAAVAPGGDGSATIVIDALGNVTLKGVLGDGAKVSQKAFLTAGGLWPFYVALYSGKGSILGWLTVENLVDSDITGTVDWFKLAGSSGLYPAGFTNEIDVAGSRFQATAGVSVLNLAPGEVILMGGNLSQNITNNITLGADNKVTNLSSNALKLSISTTTGAFKGTVANPATGKSIKVGGVVLQKQNVGGGEFPGTTQTGSVTIEAAP